MFVIAHAMTEGPTATERTLRREADAVGVKREGRGSRRGGERRRIGGGTGKQMLAQQSSMSATTPTPS